MLQIESAMITKRKRSEICLSVMLLLFGMSLVGAGVQDPSNAQLVHHDHMHSELLALFAGDEVGFPQKKLIYARKVNAQGLQGYKVIKRSRAVLKTGSFSPRKPR